MDRNSDLRAPAAISLPVSHLPIPHPLSMFYVVFCLDQPNGEGKRYPSEQLEMQSLRTGRDAYDHLFQPLPLPTRLPSQQQVARLPQPLTLLEAQHEPV